MTNALVGGCEDKDELNRGFSSIKTLIEPGPVPIGATHWAHKLCQVPLLSLHQLNEFFELVWEAKRKP